MSRPISRSATIASSLAPDSHNCRGLVEDLQTLVGVLAATGKSTLGDLIVLGSVRAGGPPLFVNRASRPRTWTCVGPSGPAI